MVNTIYRELTGDEIKAPAKMIGSALIGGPIGLAIAMVDTAVEDATGKDMGGHAMAMFQGDETESPIAGSAALAVVSSGTGAINSGPSREFIPAALTTASSAQLLVPGIIEDDEIEEKATPAPEETEAAIAAAAATAPQGLVFMPLPGRQTSSSFKPVNIESRAQTFMPLKPVDRSTAVRPAASRTLDQAALAQLQAKAAFPTATMGQPSRLNPLLEATKPSGDTGAMPPADPFAAARRIADESGAVGVPAWFDRAMIDALDKYRASEPVKKGPTAG